MNFPIIVQGRTLQRDDIVWINSLIERNPQWGRSRLSRHIAQSWHWTNLAGQLKDIAARSMLRRLDSQGLIRLPAPLSPGPHTKFANRIIQPAPHSTDPISGPLSDLRPVRLEPILSRDQRDLFAHLLHAYHYLSYSRPVGENLAYLIFDRVARPLGCLLFGAAAWKAADRDRFVGWSAPRRREHLHLLANNMRFLILPWVRVPHLASHVLALATRVLSDDWRVKYAHPIHLLETFVDRDRFTGTAYAAANWTRVGETTGRSRNDRDRKIRVPVKIIYCYPLSRNFRGRLSGSS